MKIALNIRSIVKVLSHLVVIEGMIMLIPAAICLCYGESDWQAFIIAVAAAMGAGGIGTLLTRGGATQIRMREGFILTSIIWIIYGIFGMIPFMLCQTPIGLTDAMFETISGFTTTGASVLRDVESMSHGILFWRALTQWLGGLGIILFMLAVLPELNRPVGISMFNAETSGITHDKLHPRIRQTALSLWGVYVAVTAVSILLLWAGPMNLFDSICQTFTAIATGGFSTRNNGIEYWHSDYVLAVLTVVMTIGGISFMVLYSAWKKGFRVIRDNDVTKAFFRVILAAYLLLLLCAAIRGESLTADHYLFHPIFHVVSAITSTGFSISEVETWGPFSCFLTLLLMLCGSCAGSTAGGIKVDRLIVLYRNLVNELRRTVFPKRTYVVDLNGSFLKNSMISRVSAFVALYMLITLIATGIITLYGYSFTDSLFMSASSIGCNGLGYGATGVGGSFALLPDSIKWLLTLLMLIGRLELFTFIVLFLPSFWRR